MNYVGDFPPCTHKFVNSNGVVLCEWCGSYPPSAVRTFTMPTTRIGAR